VAESVDGGLATAMQFGQSYVLMSRVSSAPPATRRASTGAVVLGEALRGNQFDLGHDVRCGNKSSG
jgi:hypothetical protein